MRQHAHSRMCFTRVGDFFITSTEAVRAD